MDQEYKMIGAEIRMVNHLLTKRLEKSVRAAGIDEVTLMHGWIMRFLYENREKAIYQKDIEKHFAIGRSTVTSSIQIMEKKGYITRQAVAGDARLKRVLLSQKGIVTHETIEDLIVRMNREMLKGIEEEELRVFMKVLLQIKDNVEIQNSNCEKGV